MPKVSVLMPAYNASSYIGEAIQSILEQPFSEEKCNYGIKSISALILLLIIMLYLSFLKSSQHVPGIVNVLQYILDNIWQ